MADADDFKAAIQRFIATDAGARDADGSRIFSLFSRFMREGLSTAPAATRPESGLSGPVFS
ncbi:hypothetical protein ACUN0C_14555 [Faunimonas sp. B44]|uniref:hypothetical protein n=1 Tax=Faunimonas sp. B44 TaxID=3461493 RepID=UPI004044065D